MRTVQVVLFLLLADYYISNFAHWSGLADEVVQLILYPWLIVNVAANPRNVLPVGNRAFDYLGKISYGIYMLHMVAVYGTSALFKATGWWRSPLWLYCVLFYTIVFGVTFLLAHLSYLFFESPFLRLKEQRFSLLTSSPVA